MSNDRSDDTATEPDTRAGRWDSVADTDIKPWNIVEPVETSKDYEDAVRARGGTVVSPDSTDSMAFDPYDTSDGAIVKSMNSPDDMESFTLGGCPFCGGTVTAEVKSTQYSNGVPNLLHRAYSVYAACENGCPITRVSRILLHDYVSPADEDSLPVEERRGNAKEALRRSWEDDCETIVQAEPCPRCGKLPLFSLSGESTALRFGCGDTGLAETENDDTSLAELAGEWNKLVSEVKDDMEYRKRREDMCAVWNSRP